MTINTDKNSTQIENLIYEKPSLKKYGNMKELTLNSLGSGGNDMASDGNNGKINDAKLIDDGDTTLAD